MRSTARHAARRPAPSPSKHNTGSFSAAGMSFHNSWICVSVSAVPSGATAPSKPAPTKAITSIYPSATITGRPSAAAWRARDRL